MKLSYAKKGLNSQKRFLPNVWWAVILLYPLLSANFLPLTFQQKSDIRREIQRFMEEQSIPGLQFAIAKEGSVIWKASFGFADVEQKVRLSAHQKMRIASISKAITGIGVGKLIEQGKLDLSAEVQQYVPYFPRKQYPILVRDVAGHIAGIRNYRGNEYQNAKHFDTVREALGMFMEDSLEFRPRTRYQYATYNWNLMSAVVEGAAQSDFLTWMQREVFRPLGMTHTEAEDWRRARHHTVQYYQKTPSGDLRPAPFVDNSNKWAGGGFLSTAEDVAILGAKVSAGQFLRPQTFQLLTTSLQLENGDFTGYGIGWAVDTQIQPKVVGHTGSAVGGSSILAVQPESQTTIVLICNLQNVNLVPLAYRILLLAQS